MGEPQPDPAMQVEPTGDPPSPGGAPPYSASTTPVGSTERHQALLHGRLRYTHDAMIDLIIAHPEWSQNQIAAHFGYSAAWISQLFCSDAFREKLAARREEIIDPTLRATVEERFQSIARQALDIISSKLAKHPDAVSDRTALRALEVSARALGYGARPVAPAPHVDLEVHLHTMSDRLTRLLAVKRTETIDAQVVEGVP